MNLVVKCASMVAAALVFAVPAVASAHPEGGRGGGGHAIGHERGWGASRGYERGWAAPRGYGGGYGWGAPRYVGPRYVAPYTPYVGPRVYVAPHAWGGRGFAPHPMYRR
jgi:hypothetical protein